MTSPVPEFLKDKWRQSFRFHDLNNDGKITKEDFAQLADNIARETNASEEKRQIIREQWVKWFRYFQPDPSITVTLERYMESGAELYQDVEHLKKLNSDTASTMFDMIDLNNSGAISLKEFQVYYKALGRTSPVEILEKFKKIDKDGDGYIRRDEFIDDQVRFFTDPDPVSGQGYVFSMPDE